MQEGHKLVDIPVGVYQVIVHVAGMGGRVADTLQPVDFGNGADQAAKPPDRAVRPFAVEGVDVLAKQCDFLCASLNKIMRFIKYLIDGAGIFRAACIGHNAERTELVAALLY